MGACAGVDKDPTERAHLANGRHAAFASADEEAQMMPETALLTVNIAQLPGNPVQIHADETVAALLELVSKRLQFPSNELEAWMAQIELPLAATMEDSSICNNCSVEVRPAGARSWSELIVAHHNVHDAARKNNVVGLKFVGRYAPELIDVADKGNNWTPLHHAANYSRSLATATLVEGRADVHKQDCRGDTPLHLAVISGSEKVAIVLLNAKANVGVIDSDGKTAIDYAQQHGQQMVDLLRIK